MNPITRVARNFSRRARERRAAIFRGTFHIDRNTRLLDLGSESGSNINSVLRGSDIDPRNVYIGDIDPNAVTEGHRQFGFTPVLIGESESLPFPDKFFDIVYCSSVIEHVTVPKEMVWKLISGAEFNEESRKRQTAFAAEIARLGREYFVQTPYRNFPIESHSWLPFVGWFPRWLLVPVLRFTNLFWVKKTSPDWYLLDRDAVAELFPSAEIIDEKAFGMTKSIMAVYRELPPISKRLD